MSKLVRYLLPLIGLLIFIIILTRVNILETLEIIKSIKLEYYVLALVISVLNSIPKAYKWKFLIKENISLWKAVKAWLMASSLGLITPGKVGDAIRAKLVGVKFSKALPSVIIDRIFDLIVFVILAFIGSLFLFPEQQFILFAILIVLLILTYIFLHEEVYDFFKKILVKLNLKIFEKELDIFKLSVLEVKSVRVLAKLSFWTLVSNFINILAFYLILLSLNVDLSIFVSFIIIPIVLVIEALPISFGGLGIRDATSIGLLSLFAVNTETAFAFSLLIFLAYVFVALIGLIFWFNYKNHSSK